MMTYYEKLKDPRWQKKRLEVMERDEFTCQNCGDDESTLNVHHWYYTSGADPWDYEDEALVCLCETCHKKIEELRLRLARAIARSNCGSGFETQLHIATGYIKGWTLSSRNETEEIISAGELDGVGLAWGRSSSFLRDVIDMCDWDGIQRGHDDSCDDDDEKSWLISFEGLIGLIASVYDENRSINEFQAGHATGFNDAGWWI